MALEAASAAADVRCCLLEADAGPDTVLPVTSIGEEHLPMVFYTDRKAVYDNIVMDSSMPSDPLVASSFAGPCRIVSGGPQRGMKKTHMWWVPTRWQVADGLSKPGLGRGPHRRVWLAVRLYSMKPQLRPKEQRCRV